MCPALDDWNYLSDNQYLLFQNPSFHVSVAWMLGDVTDKITSSHKENIQVSDGFLLGHL